jgi:hypothetical protein
VRYYIRQHKKHVSGPHEIDAIRGWIREGKVRQEMEFSPDGVEWMLGIELADLFPLKRRRKRRVRRRSRF